MSTVVISSILFLIVIMQSGLIIYPIYKRKLRRVELTTTTDLEVLGVNITHVAQKMTKSRRIAMSFSDDESLYAALSKIKANLLRKKENYIYSYFNFPLAFLLLGLLDQFEKYRNDEILWSVQIKCKTLINGLGELKFTVDKVDQAYLGLLFLRLYGLTLDECYLKASHRIYEEIQVFKGSDGLYRYRMNSNIFFIDTVGLVCPFLVQYGEVAGVNAAVSDAESLVKFALSHCTGPNQKLAYHAFDLTRRQPLGSVNWARGMGWLLLGLSAVVKVNPDPELCGALQDYATVLEQLRVPGGYWSQFLGHTNDAGIDSSATLMFFYAFQQCGIWTLNSDELVNLVGQCVDRKWRVVQSSGDTIYINKYSRSKGPSELSQGLLLSVFARALL